MAVDLEAALTTLARLNRDDTSAIELYRADWATPQDLEAMRFWAQGELNRIQSGFSSTDEVIKILSGILGDIIGKIDNVEGSEGEKGDQGPPGEAGRASRVFQQPNDPGCQAFAGDFWIKTGTL